VTISHDVPGVLHRKHNVINETPNGICFAIWWAEVGIQMSNTARKHLVLWLLVSGFAIPSATPGATAESQAERPKRNSAKVKSVVYTNKKYGFRFSLPETWRGYSIRISEWGGGDGRTYQPGEAMPPAITGPLISIGNPLSTDSNPRQNIPIMVFTKAQWKLVEEGKLIVSAAPVGPSELGRNAKYVFALPPRFDYADLPGREEVGQIIQSHPLHAF
jgi:hypothetical protein